MTLKFAWWTEGFDPPRLFDFPFLTATSEILLIPQRNFSYIVTFTQLIKKVAPTLSTLF